MINSSEISERVEGWIRGPIENPDFLPYSVKMDGLKPSEIQEKFTNSSQRDKKDLSILSLQLGVDAYLNGEITREDYLKVENCASSNVKSYYQGESISNLEIPKTDCTTRESGLPGDEILIEKWVEDLNHSSEEIDSVIGIASGGLEPAIVASHVLDTDLDIVRYSRDKNDRQVREVNTNYQDNVLIVDDTKYSGHSLEEVQNHVSKRSDNVYCSVVIEGELDKLRKIPTNLFGRRWKYADNNPT